MSKGCCVSVVVQWCSLAESVYCLNYISFTTPCITPVSTDLMSLCFNNPQYAFAVLTCADLYHPHYAITHTNHYQGAHYPAVLAQSTDEHITQTGLPFSLNTFEVLSFGKLLLNFTCQLFIQYLVSLCACVVHSDFKTIAWHMIVLIVYISLISNKH